MAVDTFPGAGVALVRDDPRNRYNAGKVAVALAATPTDVVTICGSASKRIRVLSICVSGSAATAAQAIPVQIVMQSTASTGGTATAGTAVPVDSSMAAATAAVAQYTANPTSGTDVGMVAQAVVPFGLATTGGAGVCFDFATRNGPGLVLNGVAENLAINLAGVTLNNATTLNYSICWEEE